MKLLRRQLSASGSRRCRVPGRSRVVAWAQNYPTRPVRDRRRLRGRDARPTFSPRLMAQWLSQRLGQQFIIENRPGAGGNIGAEIVAKATADGYTLLMVPPRGRGQCHALRASQFQFPARHSAGRRRGARAQCRRGQSVSPGQNHSGTDRLRQGQSRQAQFCLGRHRHREPFGGRIIQHHDRRQPVSMCAYRGDWPAMADLIAGQVAGRRLRPMIASIGHIRAGQLRPLAVTTIKRSDALPDIPSVSDFLPGYEASSMVRHRRAAGNTRRDYR